MSDELRQRMDSIRDEVLAASWSHALSVLGEERLTKMAQLFGLDDGLPSADRLAEFGQFFLPWTLLHWVPSFDRHEAVPDGWNAEGPAAESWLVDREHELSDDTQRWIDIGLCMVPLRRPASDRRARPRSGRSATTPDICRGVARGRGALGCHLRATHVRWARLH